MNMYYFLPLHFHKFLMPMKEGRTGGAGGGGKVRRRRGGEEWGEGGKRKEGKRNKERRKRYLAHSQSISFSVPNQITIPPKDTNLATSLLLNGGMEGVAMREGDGPLTHVHVCACVWWCVHVYMCVGCAFVWCVCLCVCDVCVMCHSVYTCVMCVCACDVCDVRARYVVSVYVMCEECVHIWESACIEQSTSNQWHTWINKCTTHPS